MGWIPIKNRFRYQQWDRTHTLLQESNQTLQPYPTTTLSQPNSRSTNPPHPENTYQQANPQSQNRCLMRESSELFSYFLGERNLRRYRNIWSEQIMWRKWRIWLFIDNFVENQTRNNDLRKENYSLNSHWQMCYLDLRENSTSNRFSSRLENRLSLHISRHYCKDGDLYSGSNKLHWCLFWLRRKSLQDTNLLDVTPI